MDVKTVSQFRRFSTDRMQKVNVFATEKLFLDVYGLEPGQKQKPHRHSDSDKIYVVLEGRGRFQIDQDVGEVRPGEAVLAAAGSEHGVENPGPERLVILVVMAPPPRHA
jgi:mannose-6-phosphate isomerase-like protein (cupin superfamily)